MKSPDIQITLYKGWANLIFLPAIMWTQFINILFNYCICEKKKNLLYKKKLLPIVSMKNIGYILSIHNVTSFQMNFKNYYEIWKCEILMSSQNGEDYLDIKHFKK